MKYENKRNEALKKIDPKIFLTVDDFIKAKIEALIEKIFDYNLARRPNAFEKQEEKRAMVFYAGKDDDKEFIGNSDSIKRLKVKEQSK